MFSSYNIWPYLLRWNGKYKTKVQIYNYRSLYVKFIHMIDNVRDILHINRIYPWCNRIYFDPKVSTPSYSPLFSSPLERVWKPFFLSRLVRISSFYHIFRPIRRRHGGLGKVGNRYLTSGDSEKAISVTPIHVICLIPRSGRPLLDLNLDSGSGSGFQI